jgi:hypothetical protein
LASALSDFRPAPASLNALLSAAMAGMIQLRFRCAALMGQVLLSGAGDGANRCQAQLCKERMRMQCSAVHGQNP